MTIGYVARRLVEAYGRDAARDKAWLMAIDFDWTVDSATRTQEHKVVARAIKSAAVWRSVARACTRVPVPARRGATP